MLGAGQGVSSLPLHSPFVALNVVRGDANRRNLSYRESQHGKAIMSSSCWAGRREKLEEGEGGKEGGRGKRYENMTCLRIGSEKTIHSSGFFFFFLNPLFPPVSSPPRPSSLCRSCLGLPAPPTAHWMFDLETTIHLKSRKTMVCPPPPLSIPPRDPVWHGNAPQSGKICFEVLLDAVEAIDMPPKHDYILAWEKTDDGCQIYMSSMTCAFLRQNTFPLEVMRLA